jgi:hypothetical protein
MPQLDLITFFDQTFYVYTFFIIQYIIISVFVLPSIYQILSLKNFLVQYLFSDINTSLIFLKNSLINLDIIESKFESKIVPFV